MLQLRDYQTQVIFDTYKFFHIGLKSVLLYAPTGAGKTAIASQIIADYVGQGKRVLFLVHRTKLVRQTQDTLQKFHGIDCSVIWASEGKPDYSKPVQKEDCWIIDYCGNIKRLGLPTQRYPISLCPAKITILSFNGTINC